MNGDSDGTPAGPSLLQRALEEQNRQQLLDVLGDPICRRVLHGLDADEERVTLSELAERVVNTTVRGAASVEVESQDVDISATERVAIRLHHVHLPKLADHGLLEYDRRENTVQTGTSL